MPKRLKFFISSVVAGATFFLLLTLPFELRYQTLGGILVVLVLGWWFGLSLWNNSWWEKLATGFLAWLFWIGFAMFSQLLPYSVELALVLSGVVVAVWYVMFLVENIFMVAIGFKTVPLYRAAWTVSLLLTLLTSFFVFNTIWSYKLDFWLNGLLVMVVSVLIFAYTQWVVAIETGVNEWSKGWQSVVIPAIVMAQLAAILSFWPLGIFRASMYLVWGVYILTSLLQVELRERLFKRTLVGFGWIMAAVILALVVTTGWR